MAERSFQVSETGTKPLHWGLVSEYRREIMSVATILVICSHYTFKWLDAFLRFCSDRSIELYITHVSIRNIFETYDPKGLLDRNAVSGYGIVIVLAVIVSILIHPVIQKISSFIIRNCGKR